MPDKTLETEIARRARGCVAFRATALALLVSLSLTIGFVQTARATAQLVPTRSEWGAAVGAYDTEDFETTGLNQGGCLGWMPGFVGNSCAHEIRIDSAKLDFVFGIGSHPQQYVYDSGQVNGTREIRGDLHSSTNIVSYGPRYNRIEFPLPVIAFAVDLAGFYSPSPTGDPPASLLLLAESFLIESGTSFIGVISDEPFSEVTLAAEEVPYMTMWYYVDDISFVPVPEPSTGLLLAAGLAAFAVGRRTTRIAAD